MKAFVNLLLLLLSILFIVSDLWILAMFAMSFIAINTDWKNIWKDKRLMFILLLIAVNYRIYGQKGTEDLYRLHLREMNIVDKVHYRECIAVHRTGQSLVIESESGRMKSFLIVKKYTKRNGFIVFMLICHRSKNQYVLRLERGRTVLYRYERHAPLGLVCFYEGNCE